MDCAEVAMDIAQLLVGQGIVRQVAISTDQGLSIQLRRRLFLQPRGEHTTLFAASLELQHIAQVAIVGIAPRFGHKLGSPGTVNLAGIIRSSYVPFI